MNLKRMFPLLFLSLLGCLQFKAAAQDTLASSLDGKSFDGELKLERGIFGWVRVKDSVVFSNGTFIWSSGVGGGYKPATYETREENGKLIFTVRSRREEGDYVDWEGVYDGESISELKGVWTLVENDFIHNLLFPQQVVLVFEQNSP